MPPRILQDLFIARQQRISQHLTQFNPRAFTQNPPHMANTHFMQVLYTIIQDLRNITSYYPPLAPASATQIDVHLQVITAIYNHFAFILRQNWVPQ